jgi:Na+/glutamate symporter
MILGLLIGAVLGIPFGAWLLWSYEIRRAERVRQANAPYPTWVNAGNDRLHGRKA